MESIETTRLVLRPFRPGDWSDVQELAVDWKSAPGPEFDKWPISEEEAKGLTGHFLGKPGQYFAVSLRSNNKVIGLLALNGIDADKRMDLGHVILSTYQDDAVDREALGAMVGHVFSNEEVESIITRNADYAKQLAPLRSLGFTNASNKDKGELVLSRLEWEPQCSK